jgi:hypothetical protein
MYDKLHLETGPRVPVDAAAGGGDGRRDDGMAREFKTGI